MTKADMDAQQGTQPPEDLEQMTEVAFSGPAIFANRFTVNVGPGGVRITGLEQHSPTSPLHFRACIVTPFDQAIALKDVLTRTLKDLEAQINSAEKTAEKAGGQEAVTESGSNGG